nr:hypothetical protein [Tanacetum cinerariifolium]
MGEPTREEYMTNTQEDYSSGIVRPKIDENARFDLKGQFLKELCDNTFSGSDNEDANEHIEKILDIVDLFHIPKEVILFYKELDVPTRQILDSNGAILIMKAADAKKAIQDMGDHSQKWHNGTSTRIRSTDISEGLAAIQDQLNNLGREIKKVNKRVYAAQVGAAALKFYQRDNGNPSYPERRETLEESLRKFMVESAKRHDENYNLIKEIIASMDATIRNQEASIKAWETKIRKMIKAVSILQNMMQFFEPSQSIIHFPSQLIDDSYKEKEVLKEFMMPQINSKESATDLKRLVKEKPRMGHQIEASINVHNSEILKDDLPPKEKDLGSFTIPFHINNICFQIALADLGARCV